LFVDIRADAVPVTIAEDKKKKIDVAVLITMVDCFFETLQHPALQGKVLSAITSICWFLLGWW